MKKVTFKDNQILADGVVVGRVEGSPEIYVYAVGQALPIARFKYFQRRKKSVQWIRFVFARLSPAEIIEKLKSFQTSPLQLALDLGMPNLTAPKIPS